MCFKGSEICPAAAAEAEKPTIKQPKTIDQKEFDLIAARLRAGLTTPASILKELDITESSIIRTRQSLAAFLEQCADNETDPIECFIEVLKTFMSDYGYIKEDKKAVIKARQEEAKSLTDRLEEARSQGDKDQIIEIALLVIEDQQETIRMLERKACLA